MSNMSTEETEDSQEMLLEETSPEVADREEPSGESSSSSSSSDGSNESQQREVSSSQDLTQVQSISLQGPTHQDEVENGAARSPHFQEAGILLNAASAGSSEHLPTPV
ncbi:hypothetical protein PanWU01x14_258490 [Parasponia andersonii]|uniref:Uncharacterized protein n=1 Tax=Parasponia andersonii TaxID=3476 RepID=A0A2P5B9P1_PARAD|nr:hypothetical protein PanWU01x14_258490 [Parasponia andersonii]